jgi:hypothetical protein
MANNYYNTLKQFYPTVAIDPATQMITPTIIDPIPR